ncbi:MAG TPA: cellulase N-terminal Ig-like domain-containing protein, partial [Polyangiaceae bacterium]|nr:cellulase N-terminal Ig-like domain-containing protein [Polyangiaceae bacterium]
MFRKPLRRSSIMLLLSFSTVATEACHSGQSTSAAGANTTAGAAAGDAAGASAAAGAPSAVGGSDGTAGAGTAGTSMAGSGGVAPIDPPRAKLSKFIVVDQFGYLPDSEKIAVVRDPQTGFDGDEAFTPSASLSLIDARTGATALSAAVTAWNGGATDASSGDKAWWFDFSKVTQPGTYYVLDADHDARSDLFEISDTVYRDV